MAMMLPLLWTVHAISAKAPRDGSDTRILGFLYRFATSRLALGLLALVMLLVLILSQSRTAMAATVLCLVLVLRPSKKQAVLLLVFAGIVFGVLLVLLNPLEAGWELRALNMLPGSYTWRGRPEIWRNAIKALQDYPLTGIGLNSFESASRARYAFLVCIPSWDFVHAHNVFLQVGLDYGLVGLISFSALVIAVYRVAIQTRASVKNARTERIITGLLGSLTVYIAFGSIDAVVLGAKPSVLFWLVTGLISRIAIENRQLGVQPKKRVLRPLTVLCLAVALVISIAFRDPLVSLALSNWAHLAINKGMYEQAGAILAKSIDAYPSNRSAWRAKLEISSKMHDPITANRIAQRLGMDATPFVERGESFRLLGELDDAAFWARQALALDPDFSDAWYYLGLIHQDRGLAVEAARAFENAMAFGNFSGNVNERDVLERYHQPHSWIFVDAADSWIKMGNTQQAIDLLQTVTRIDPRYGSAWAMLGKAYLEQGDVEQAIDALRTALGVHQDGYWGYALLGEAYEMQHKWEEAVHLQLTALTVAKKEKLVLRSVFQIMELYAKLGDACGACGIVHELWNAHNLALKFEELAPMIGCNQ